MKSKIRSMREKSGMSLTAMALSMAMEPSLLSLIERGKRTCKENADKIADALGVDPKSLWDDYESFQNKRA